MTFTNFAIAYLFLNGVFWWYKYNELKKDYKGLLYGNHILLNLYTESVADDNNSN